jgi:Raf kinase inhibitor-like YbhB/YbcL family protein
MKTLTIAAALLALLVCSAAPSGAKSTFSLGSDAFVDGGTIPHRHSYNGYGCTGKNISPELHWSDAPEGTKSFALTVFDPDANKGKGWWHWVVYGIDPGTHSLAAGEPPAGVEGKTDFGTSGWGGPCPPPGDPPHHYVFTLYALNEDLQSASDTLSGPQLLDAIKDHTIGKATLVGRFGR